MPRPARQRGTTATPVTASPAWSADMLRKIQEQGTHFFRVRPILATTGLPGEMYPDRFNFQDEVSLEACRERYGEDPNIIGVEVLVFQDKPEGAADDVKPTEVLAERRRFRFEDDEDPEPAFVPPYNPYYPQGVPGYPPGAMPGYPIPPAYPANAPNPFDLLREVAELKAALASQRHPAVPAGVQVARDSYGLVHGDQLKAAQDELDRERRAHREEMARKDREREEERRKDRERADTRLDDAERDLQRRVTTAEDRAKVVEDDLRRQMTRAREDLEDYRKRSESEREDLRKENARLTKEISAVKEENITLREKIAGKQPAGIGGSVGQIRELKAFHEDLTTLFGGGGKAEAAETSEEAQAIRRIESTAVAVADAAGKVLPGLADVVERVRGMRQPQQALPAPQTAHAPPPLPAGAVYLVSRLERAYQAGATPHQGSENVVLRLVEEEDLRRLPGADVLIGYVTQATQPASPLRTSAGLQWVREVHAVTMAHVAARSQPPPPPPPVPAPTPAPAASTPEPPAAPQATA